MKSYLSPQEITEAMLSAGVAKTRLPADKAVILAILAGVYIGFAAHLATVIATGDVEWLGARQFLTGAVFSFGLMLVIIPGSELWTGNTLMGASLFDGRITFRGLVRNWMLVYLGNFAGSVLLAWIIVSGTGILDGEFGGTAIRIAYAKVTTQVHGVDHNIAYFFRGVGCNWLVCLAVLMAMSAQDISGKIFGIFFPIMAFVASGFEHSVANMYFLPAGIFAKSFPAAVAASGIDPAALVMLNWKTIWLDNLVAVTLGNLLGGGLFVGSIMWWLHGRNSD